MVRAAPDGTLAKIETRKDEIFGLHAPVSCPDVAPDVLIPESTLQDKAAYREKAESLAKNFQKNSGSLKMMSRKKLKDCHTGIVIDKIFRH